MKYVDHQSSGLLVTDTDSIYFKNSFFSEKFGSRNAINVLQSAKEYTIDQKASHNATLIQTLQVQLKQDSQENRYMGIYEIGLDFYLIYCQKICQESKNCLVLNIIDITVVLHNQNILLENNYKQMFIRSLSHETRHPVTTIQSITSLAIQKIQKIDQVKGIDYLTIRPFLLEYLQSIEQQASYLLNISQQLVDISDIQSSTFQLQPEQFNVQNFLDSTMDLIRKDSERKGLTLFTKVNHKIPEDVVADQKRIRAILQNMLQNSLKYTKKGFISIQASLSKKEKHSQIMSTIKKDQRKFTQICKIRVIDSGCGIDEQKQKALFDLFSHASNRNFSLERPTGIGLGLFLSQRLAIQLGKKSIQFKRKDDTTIFQFYFVFNTINSLIKSADKEFSNNLSLKSIKSLISMKFVESPKLKRLQKMRKCSSSQVNRIYKERSFSVRNQIQCNCPQILLVDDTEIIRFCLSEILQKFKLAEARDGEEAVQFVQERMNNYCCNNFQLIIMDCEMPLKDGWTATQEIKQLGYEGPILGYTAYSNAQDVERCIKSGMNDVLAKPAKTEILLRKIETLRQKKQRIFEQKILVKRNSESLLFQRNKFESIRVYRSQNFISNTSSKNSYDLNNCFPENHTTSQFLQEP